MRGIFFAALCFALSCGPPSADRQAREYARLAVALGERDPDSIDFYYGPPDWVADVRKNPPRLDQIRDSARRMAQQIESAQQLRSRRLARQLRAIAERADELLGARRSFDERTRIYFGVYAAPLVHFSGEMQRAGLDRLLPGEGSLAERYDAFDRQFLIPEDRVETVITRALQGCRDQTKNHLRLPAGESVRVEYVHNKPWSAFSRYQGNFQSIVSINADLPLTVDRALQLMCHEAYPGHHAQNVLQDVQLVRNQRLMEFGVQPTFSPQSLVSEALATYAPEIAFPGDEGIRFERDALFPLAGLDPKKAAVYVTVERLIDDLAGAELGIARDFIDGKLEWARAAAALEEQALMAHPEQTLKYINEYRSYVITYTLGPELMVREAPGWRQFGELMTDPNAADRLMMNR